MEEFKGNSNVAKEPKLDEKPKIQPITSAVTVKKESETKKLGKRFFSEDAKSVGGQVFGNVIIPSLQRLVSDAVKTAIDWIIYGKATPMNGGPRNISYTSYWRGPNAPYTPAPQIPASAYTKPTVYNVNEIIFDDRGEAEEVLMRLQEEVARYGLVSVADFYDMISQKHNFTDCKWGWRDLSQAQVMRLGAGFSISFPTVRPIE